MKELLCILMLAAAPLSAGVVSREAAWNVDGATITATITLPGGKGPYPGVVMVAGSGPTDRNWCSRLLPGSNCSAPLIAEALAKAGFAVVRYDKSVTGPNAAANMALMYGKLSMQSHMAEVAAAAAALRKEPSVDGARVFAFTNSEGALHALNCQNDGGCNFAGLVLEGVPGRSTKAVLRGQIAAQVAAMPDHETVMAGFDKLMANFTAGLPFAPDQQVPAGINQLFAGFYNPVNLPFARELMAADPAAMAAKVKVPVLVVIGKKDVQTDWELDGAPLRQALAANDQAKFVFPADANHVLKYEPKPREQLSNMDGLQYNAAGRVLDPAALKEIIAWLNLTAKRK